MDLIVLKSGFIVQLYGVVKIFQVIGIITIILGLFGMVMQNVLWGREEANKAEQNIV
ncbi:hypothetical protein J11TS1_08220 [Oceanobacillus sp. J11TS1]|nr:hypothetical protein J11TS1_08220 [Oceanobacillus sp. J11TS1]